MIINSIPQFGLTYSIRRVFRFSFIVLYLMVVMPYFYNLGSSEIGCPIYEYRTGLDCSDILE
jgi:hypothetical protein